MTLIKCQTGGDLRSSGMLHIVGNVRNYQYTLYNIIEEQRSHIHRVRTLKSHIKFSNLVYLSSDRVLSFLNGVCNFKNSSVLCLNFLTVRPGSEICLFVAHVI